MTVSDIWPRCEGQLVNGVFPLRRLLGTSDHSAVFLSEWPARNLTDVALKLIPAHPALARLQLSHWSTASALSHAHLLALLEMGRWALDDQHFLFVVMEYAQENLAQVLPQRALTPDEVRHMLPPMVAALSYVHSRNLVHGRMKPSNVLVVGDEVKISSDGVRPPGESTSVADFMSAYDPPEARAGRISSAGDIWSLAFTVVEALTQRLPVLSSDHLEPVALPETIPPDMADILRKCLSRDPDNRPSIAALATEFKLTPPPAVASQPHTPPPAPTVTPSVSPITADALPADSTTRRLPWAPVFAGVVIVALLAGWAIRRLNHQHAAPQAPPPVTAAPVPPARPTPIAEPPPSRAEQAQPTVPPASADPVVRKTMPKVSRASLETIHGRIKVSVRVSVDAAGNVVNESVEMAGPSRYFARVAADAAREWKFVPASEGSARQWLVWFEFTHDGTTGHVQ